MKKTILSLIVSLACLVCFAQQSQLSKNNELAGDKALQKDLITSAANYYKLAFKASPNDVLLVKYCKTAYKAGDYNGIKNIVADDTKSAEALKFKGLAVFENGLKYNIADKEAMTDAYHSALVYLKKADASKDIEGIRQRFAELEF